MDDDELAEVLADHRSRLTAAAFHILGSTAEADDAVQAAWSRLDRVAVSDIDDLGGWVTSEVARTCLDLLRSRAPDQNAGPDRPRPARRRDDTGAPEHDSMLSESLAAALLVVLDTLAPAERVAFVLHDLFATPYDEIATMLGRSATATRQLAGRARRRVLAPERTLEADRTVHSRVVEAFLSAARDDDVEEMAWLLHPDAVLRADQAAVAAGAEPVTVGADSVAGAIAGAIAGQAGTVRPALLDGFAAAAGSSGGTRVVLAFTVLDGRVAEVELIAEPAVLATLDLVAGSATP